MAKRKKYNYFKPDYDGKFLSWFTLLMAVTATTCIFFALFPSLPKAFNIVLTTKDFIELASVYFSLTGTLWICCGVLLNPKDKKILLEAHSYNQNLNVLSNAALSASRTVIVGAVYVFISVLIFTCSKFV